LDLVLFKCDHLLWSKKTSPRSHNERAAPVFRRLNVGQGGQDPLGNDLGRPDRAERDAARLQSR
jgi:hypothetical protein